MLERKNMENSSQNSFKIAKIFRFFRSGMLGCEIWGQVLIFNDGWACNLPVWAQTRAKKYIAEKL
jgi:hypothetical protein